MQILTSPRLTLEPQMISHAGELYTLFQDPALYPFIHRTPPQSLERFQKGIESLESRTSPDGTQQWLNWVSFLSGTSQIVGQIEVTIYRDDLRANLAYYTFSPYGKKGYAREACLSVVQHLFREYRVSKVVIEMDVRNLASVKLAESLGAMRIALRPRAEFLKGEWSDEYTYELLSAPQE